MTLKKYNRIENQQFNELISLNEQCLERLEEESYENLLSLFKQRDKLTKELIADEQEDYIIQQLNEFDKIIFTKIIQKKEQCAESLSVFYRRHNAKNGYIETHNNLLNCK